MSLRIAISGSAGTGKTTLGRTLASSLDLPFIEEGMRTRLEGGLNLHQLDHEAFVRLHDELFEEHRDACHATSSRGFVSDRCCADFAAFRIHYNLLFPEEETDRVLEKILSHFDLYDAIILVPWGVFPIEDDGIRTRNRWTQFRFHAILEALLERYAPRDRIYHLPAIDGLEKRLQSVLERLSAKR